ncbi:hypothetical protein E9993_06235 [Labilibacter sediminis]|nr:hypothetical protein E9993_06235 [Labilibacter sediminis]
MYYIHNILLFTVLFSISNLLNAQNIKEQIKLSETFKIAPSGTLDISNKYGSIYIDVWDNDSVKVDIDFTISEKNENRFQKIKNSVNFDFSGNNLYRSVKTQYGSNYSSLIKDFKEATNLFTSNEDQTHVDYHITIPNYINLKIQNKYGNVILPDLIGDVNVKLANGDLQARKLKGNNTLNLSFGMLNIKEVDQGNLTLNFMETQISKAEKLTIESKSSDIYIGKSGLLKLNAKRGKINGSEIDYVIAETEFCELMLNKVNTEANIMLKYGILKELNCDFNYESIKIKSQNADVFLKLPDEHDFSIKTSYLKASLNCNKPITWNPANVIDDKGTIEKTGHYLSNDKKTNVTISISNADLNIE